MKILRSSTSISRFRKTVSGPLVLVPTMGALHAGHAALIHRARILAGPNGTVVVSIFVNPTQFGPKEDLSRYPRPFAADAKLCRESGVDAIFHPSAPEIYPPGFSTYVDESAVSLGLCGGSRPGHFRGVCTVVLKLFTITQPDVAVFGLKDYQQCQVIRRMTRDLNLPVRLVLEATVREPDGLALSSRNIYLTPKERQQAPVLRRGLLAARTAFRKGERSAAKLHRLVNREIRTATLGRVDYISVMQGEALTPLKRVEKNDVIAVAVFFGRTRLIDNIQLR